MPNYAHFTQIKWATVSDSLRSLKTNDWPWANRSGRSRQMSDREQIAQVAHDKWVTVSDSLKKLCQKQSIRSENRWANSQPWSWAPDNCLKGQSNEIFDFQFFHNLKLSGKLTNELKYFWFWLRIRWDIRIFLSPWYPGKSIFQGYDSQASQSPRSIILKRVSIFKPSNSNNSAKSKLFCPIGQ